MACGSAKVVFILSENTPLKGVNFINKKLRIRMNNIYVLCFSIISLLSVLNKDFGLVGNILNSFYTSSFGNLKPILPIFLIGASIINLKYPTPYYQLRYAICVISSALVAGLSTYTSLNVGGIGRFVFGSLNAMFGTWAAYPIIFTMICFCIIIFNLTSKNISKLATKLKVDDIIDLRENRETDSMKTTNKDIGDVSFIEMANSEEFKNASSTSLIIGKDENNKYIISDLIDLNHILIAGETGGGKSVVLNTLISSLLLHNNPNTLKFIMIDPKTVELSFYKNIPHLSTSVVTGIKGDIIKETIEILKTVKAEMNKRYDLLEQNACKDITGYNKIASLKMPYILVIIEELEDIISNKDIASELSSLLRMARASGIYLIVATQSPYATVILPTIKANLTTRIALRVASSGASTTILDQNGAEKLKGKGDMLLKKTSQHGIQHLQGAFISDEEIKTIVQKTINTYGSYKSNLDLSKENTEEEYSFDKRTEPDFFEEVVLWAIEKGEVSASSIQMQFKVGFQKAKTMVDKMDSLNMLGAEINKNQRKDILITFEDWVQIKKNVA